MTKVTAVFLLVLSTASTLVIAAPRPAQAEGFLLNTVRCLVRTVLVEGCRSTPSPAPTPVSEPSNQTPSPSVEPSPQSDSSTGASSSVQPRAHSEAQYAPITPPESVSQIQPVIPEVSRPGAENRIPESEYIAYFNAYSPYAVQGAQSEENVVVQTSSEGWKVLGVAWYWWALAAALIFALFLSVKHGILRRSSVLSDGK